MYTQTYFNNCHDFVVLFRAMKSLFFFSFQVFLSHDYVIHIVVNVSGSCFNYRNTSAFRLDKFDFLSQCEEETACNVNKPAQPQGEAFKVILENAQ